MLPVSSNSKIGRFCSRASVNELLAALNLISASQIFIVAALPGWRQRASDELLLPIQPPRLEDAGLEDCTAPEAIKEAFLKAAKYISSPASSILTNAEDKEDDDKSCIQDPTPSDGKLSDTLVGMSPASELTIVTADYWERRYPRERKHVWTSYKVSISRKRSITRMKMSKTTRTKAPS
ncbi:hypothetical protein NE237_005172 [Protea cynaroides]|uniref:Uncharacterized protein n=1 Tax=Protea cynaroides TaxID=273540 RepID=A0A9Q0QU73_9MAGN|nr:hypothetical protein NE237_005172 [Protea cynaroides]